MTDHLQTQIVVLEAAPTWATSWRQEDNHCYVCSGKCVQFFFAPSGILVTVLIFIKDKQIDSTSSLVVHYHNVGTSFPFVKPPA